MATQNRNNIKQRMLKTASEAWGVQPTELASFDPVISMILGACAFEMEKIYNEVDVSKSRVLERLSKLLMPDVYKGPHPAHAVLHSTPTETNTVISRNTQFYYNRKIMLKESSVKETFRDVYFTPVSDYSLCKAEVLYLTYEDSFYELENVSPRNKIFSSTAGKKINKNDLWVGLKCDEDLKDLSGISFYFDWLNVSERSLLFSYLPFTKWQTMACELKSQIGYHETSDNQNLLGQEFEFDIEKIIFRNIESFYKQQFIHIPNFKITGSDTDFTIPETLKETFGDKNLQKIEKVVWVKIAFPAYVMNTEFDNMNIAVNCYPVVNRGMNEFTYRIQNTFNIVPLNIENNAFFFSVQSVKSGEGKEFSSSSIKDLNKVTSGTYVVRKGGVERFDPRSAQEYLNNLVDLMRDETASFSVYGQEMITDNIKSLNQILNQIIQRIERSGNDRTEGISYLVVKPENFNDTVFVEYWTTSGSFGNGIPISTGLNSYSSSEVNSDTLILMSTTEGGRDSLVGSELLDSFRQTLISRDRVVTEADISYFCLRELGDRAREVVITKGLQLDSSSKSGFIKTIDVTIEAQDRSIHNQQEWDFICDDLKSKLATKMSTFQPVRVSLKK